MIEFFSSIIESHGIFAIGAALGIGILTSLAPCSIAGVPLIAGFAANASFDRDSVKKAQFVKQFTFVFVSGVIVSITLLFLLMTQFKYVLNSSPITGFILAAVLCFYVAFSSLGFITPPSFHRFAQKFVKYKLYGAFIMGILIGFVSTPCASPAIASLLIVAQNQSLWYSSLLVMAFALGHSVVLIISGLSINFVQYISKKKSIGLLTSVFQKIMAIVLIIIGSYFFYRAFNLWSWL